MTWSLRRLAWLGPLVLAVLVASCSPHAGTDQRRRSQAAGEKKRPGKELKVTKQGGYVEKLAPGVDYKDRLPRIAPRGPAESLAGMHVAPGFHVELAAAEPLVVDPVDLAFDAHGRLLVAEMIPYAEGNTSAFGSPRGRIAMLEDTDGDGRLDKRTVYADELVWPTGVAPFDGGVFVAAAPDLWYFKDTDGDGRADVRELVLTGFETSNPNAVPNSLRFGLDNRLHGMTSTAGGALRAAKHEKLSGTKSAPRQARGRDFSIHPRSGELRLESGGGQFGLAFDAWGRKFESSNSAPIEMVMYEDRYLARNPYLAAPSARLRAWKHGMTVHPTSPPEPWRVVRTEMRIQGAFSGPVEGGGKPGGYFTAACGLTFYLGDAWPEGCRGQALVCEGAGNLVHRMQLEPDGVAMQADRVEEGREFWTSDEVWFRPIQLANGPDGNLYLADMYREVFEHPDAVPPSAKKYMDLTSGKDRGRIYRIAADGAPQRPFPDLGKLTAEELVPLLAHPNFWHRNTAARLLYERQDRAALVPLVKLAAESPSPLGRMHAMYALDGLGGLTEDVLLPRLADEHPRVREHAVRLAETLAPNAPAVRQVLCRMTADEDLRVRYQLAFSLGEVSGMQATAALAQVAKRDAADRWVRLAVLSSCFGRPGELFSVLAADAHWRTTSPGRSLLGQLAEQAGLQKRDDQVAEVFAAVDALPAGEQELVRAVVAGLSRGLEKSGSPLRERLASGTRSAEVLADIVRRSISVAEDEDAAVAERVEAVGSLALASWDQAGDLLADLLEGRQPQEVQKAALQALARFRAPEVAEMIVQAWPGFSPQVRGEAAEALFARPERLVVLLEAIETKQVLPSQLDPARVQFLLAHPDRKIAEPAGRLLGSAKLARREEVVAAHRDVLQIRGDAARGKAVFKKECSTCHRLEGVGYDLGLPLNTVQNRGPETVLLAVLDPNREVLPQYLNYVVETDDGLTKTGMIAEETATSITLRRAEGESDTVLRANIEVLHNTGLSIMPEGLEKQLNKQDLADVIEYLMRVR